MAWAATVYLSPSPSPTFLAPSPLSLQQCTSSSLRLQSQRLLNTNPGCRSESQKKDSRLRLSCLYDPKASVVTGNSWDKLVLNSDTPVLVEFYASWCGPCRMVHRVIDELATDYSGKLKCFVLNADMDADIAADYEIKAVPVVLLFKNGKKLEHVIGTMSKEFYIAAIERVISS